MLSCCAVPAAHRGPIGRPSTRPQARGSWSPGSGQGHPSAVLLFPDVDECAAEPPPCEDTQYCENVNGSFVCEGERRPLPWPPPTRSVLPLSVPPPALASRPASSPGACSFSAWPLPALPA